MKKYWKIILLTGIILLIAVAAVLILLLGNEKYRTIQVYDIEGAAEVERTPVGLLDAYTGMMLQSEDYVTVETESYLYLKLDEDKYVMLEPGTRVRLEAKGNSADSKTAIYLETGAIVSRLDNELSKGSSYEVITSNSTMAVRGTIFRIEVSTKEEGQPAQTQVFVFEGKVDSKLVQPDGTISETAVRVTRNTTVTIQTSEEITEYVGEPETVEYKELDTETLEFLIDAIEEREAATGENSGEEQGEEETDIPKEVLETIKELIEQRDAVSEVHTVTFVYQGMTFATQQVQDGQCATKPTLLPDLSGRWDYDFTNPVTEDIQIEWSY